MEALRFTPAQLQEPRYDRKRIVLQGEQPLSFDLGFPTDFVAFIDVSQVDPNKVYVAFNEPHEFIPISKVIVARLPVPALHRLLFTWEASEEGKTIEVYYAGAPALEIGANLVTIAGDYIDIAKDATLQSLINTVATESTLQAILQRFDAQLIADTLVSLDNSAGTAAAAMQVFASDVSVPTAGAISMQIAMDTSTTVKLRIARGGNTLEYYVNSGNALAANAWHEFEFSALANDAVNVVVDVPAGAVINAYVAIILRRR